MGNPRLVENLAYACVTKPCVEGKGEHMVCRWISSDLDAHETTYRMVESESNRIANVFKRLGIQAGDKISIFLPRSPELVNVFFGILKNQAVSCTLFSTFGESALQDRLQNSNSRILVTKKSLLKKLTHIRAELPDLRYILVTDVEVDLGSDMLSLPKLIAETDADFAYPSMAPEDTPAFLQYTSGSTGKPKGALHVHGALSSMIRSFKEIFGIQGDELYWCTADPAWITGVVYTIIAPMATDTRQLQFSGTYHAESWLSILQNREVNVWYTAPTALRMLMQEEDNLFAKYDYSKVKRIYSVGEPLNPEIYYWGKRIFGKEIYDTWWQSETGSIMIANRPGLTVKPGSMGKPVSGISPRVLDDEGNPVRAGDQGNLCLRKGWDSMFRTYYQKEDLYQQKFKGDYYFTGDRAWLDEDGYFWFVSRADDVINTAGHLVGPFEVESALLEVDDVVDVAVIGAPDPLLHEKIVAFICVRKGVEWSREMELKCRVTVSNRVSTTAIPKEFHVVDKIPKNQSGKILRRVLKATYEGKDPGDISTMEEK